MAIRVVDQPIVSFQGEAVTAPGSGGARTAWNVRRGYKELLVEATVTNGIRFQLVPGIKEILFYDASTDRWFDLLMTHPRFLDRESAIGTTMLSSMAVGDFMYVGFAGIVGGFTFDSTTVNAVTTTLTGDYSAPNKTWTALSITDGSATGGATFAQDGNITWTVPANWTQSDLKSMTPISSVPNKPVLYWARFAVSATLTAGTAFTNLTVLGRVSPTTTDNNALTGGAYLKLNVEYTMDIDDDIGAVELMSTSVTSLVTNLSWIGRR